MEESGILNKVKTFDNFADLDNWARQYGLTEHKFVTDRYYPLLFDTFNSDSMMSDQSALTINSGQEEKKNKHDGEQEENENNDDAVMSESDDSIINSLCSLSDYTLL
jgi:hypothetical protein